MVSNTCCHGGCSSQCLVDPAEVVKSEPQHNGRAMVLELFAESVRQASEAADTHPHGKVLAFDVRSANAFGIGSPDAWDHLRRDDFGGRVGRVAEGLQGLEIGKERFVAAWEIAVLALALAIVLLVASGSALGG